MLRPEAKIELRRLDRRLRTAGRWITVIRWGGAVTLGLILHLGARWYVLRRIEVAYPDPNQVPSSCVGGPWGAFSSIELNALTVVSVPWLLVTVSLLSAFLLALVYRSGLIWSLRRQLATLPVWDRRSLLGPLQKASGDTGKVARALAHRLNRHSELASADPPAGRGDESTPSS